MGPPKEGRIFWDRWLREYYQDRVPGGGRASSGSSVWDDRACAASAQMLRRPAAGEPPAQDEPAQGHRPARRRGAGGPKRLRGFDHRAARVCRRGRLSGGRPGRDRGRSAGGHPALDRPPATARRAAARDCSAHSLPAQADRPGVARQHTGLADGRRGRRALYAPHTDAASARRRTRRCCCSRTACWRSAGCARRAGKRGSGELLPRQPTPAHFLPP